MTDSEFKYWFNAWKRKLSSPNFHLWGIIEFLLNKYRKKQYPDCILCKDKGLITDPYLDISMDCPICREVNHGSKRANKQDQ